LDRARTRSAGRSKATDLSQVGFTLVIEMSIANFGEAEGTMSGRPSGRLLILTLNMDALKRVASPTLDFNGTKGCKNGANVFPRLSRHKVLQRTDVLLRLVFSRR
jgi:hypothetical protein